ncbi:hypothetical protein KFL_000310140 [Klebsormidium nitens]|uniref:Uncharacterized protein n=1 Tax=Klebsormidium nitens TaxID=105231 RepID=A0A1Y1HN65_KLENI|nr:hypothetical protein KFL_000310140 [Klebsormidium nitens]|eukprot:GAQ79463.1 hypothetical protein KFL_000310140 [Klebsormidium nitens]
MAFLGLAIGCSVLVAGALSEPAIAADFDHLHIPLDKDMRALAFNFDPLYDEFWDNVRRFILYFFSVTSGGFYMLRFIEELVKSLSKAGVCSSKACSTLNPKLQ